MSDRLGIILSKNTPDAILDQIQKKYNLFMEKIENPYMNSYLSKNEMFLTVDEYGGYLCRGTCMYEMYKKFFQDFDQIIRVCGLNNFYNMKESTDSYIKDAEKLVNIINDLRHNFKISKVGLIEFYADDKPESFKFHYIQRKVVPLKTTDVITLMQMDTNTIYLFK